MRIKNIRAFKSLNSRAEATITVKIETEKAEGFGSAPSGTSRGKCEATPFPNGIDYALSTINQDFDRLFAKSRFLEFDDLKKVEEKILSYHPRLGASPMLALEFALLDALAKDRQEPLWRILNPKAKKFPRLLVNVIGGGSHANRKFDIQEILISPETKTITDAIFTSADIYQKLKAKLARQDPNFTGGKTDEGAWATSLSVFEVLASLSETLRESQKLIDVGIDAAASQFYSEGKYLWRNYSLKHQGLQASREKQLELLQTLVHRFNLFYLEDPFHDDDFQSFADLRKKLSNKLLCGDDLICTDLNRLKTALKLKSINAVIIKPNQCGSLWKAKQVFDFALKSGVTPILSHRSGETTDNILAHLAFAWQVPFVKFGLAGGERIAKLNELIRIENNI